MRNACYVWNDDTRRNLAPNPLGVLLHSRVFFREHLRQVCPGPLKVIIILTRTAESSFNPAAEAFKNFDQLHLDEEEPRRGGSRANSVRFDESALQGHLPHVSRSSSDFFPPRSGSALGSHAMTERSSSHKSEGRQSSVGLSNHSARFNSLAIDGRLPTLGSIAPPPGLFMLGPLPAIIRCWMDTTFSTESLMYAAVCTGSFRSIIDARLVTRLGLGEEIEQKDMEQRIKLPVYLPEGMVQQVPSRTGSPPPPLPTITVDFTIYEMPYEMDAIKVILGCDALRNRNADVLFSQGRLSIFDDERNKVLIPLVRPENVRTFQNLATINMKGRVVGRESANDLSESSEASRHPPKRISHAPTDGLEGESSFSDSSLTKAGTSKIERKASDVGEESLATDQTKVETASIWGSWRRDPNSNAPPESTFAQNASSSGYQKAGRGRGMKILRPSRLQENGTSQQAGSGDKISNAPRGSFSSDLKSLVPSGESKTRSTNPIGGATAFGWLNPSLQSQSP